MRTFGWALLVISLVSCRTAAERALADGVLAPGESVEDLDEIYFGEFRCNDCSVPKLPCDFLEADTVAIVQTPDHDDYRSLEEGLYCRAIGPLRVAPVRVLGVVWGEPLEPTIDLHGLDLHRTGLLPEDQALIAVRRFEQGYSQLAGWGVKTGQSVGRRSPELDWPTNFDALVDYFAGLDPSVCSRPPDAEWVADRFRWCRFDLEAPRRVGTPCDYVGDDRVFECGEDPDSAFDFVQACAEVSAGLSEFDTDRTGVCMSQQGCDVMPVAAAAACNWEVEEVCQPVAELAATCDESVSGSAEIARRYCTDAIVGLDDQATEEYILCVTELSCDQLISGHSESECR